MLKEGVIIGKRYEIISRVGSGGMADVYKAEDHKLNRLIAIKVLKPEFREDTGFIAKFRKEAQAAAKLTHPNIVNVYDVGEDRGLYYIVMELVEGITLRNYIMKKGKLSVKEATSIAIQVSLGLEAAHNQGIVHRDVKPQNIIISTDGKVKLSDFGIAKASNSNTITANVMGSVHFSSPEQVRGGFSDYKSDIYSLGITMYEMFTGRVPFDGDTTVSIAIKHLQEEIVPPSRYTPNLPYSIEQIILKCTQKDPDRRYASMGLLIEDLKRSLIEPQGDFVQIAPAGAAATAAAGGAAVNPGRTLYTGEEAADNAAVKNRAAKKYNLYEDEEEEYERDTRRKNYDYDDYDDDKRGGAVSSKLEKAITIGGFLIGAVIIIILIVVIGNMAGLFNRKSNDAAQTSSSSSTEQTEEAAVETVRVPDLVGKTFEAAQAVAAQYGLTIEESGKEPSDQYAEGEIVKQSIGSGERVDSGSVIQVVLSEGSTKITIPAGLVGGTQTDVESVLSQLGLSATAELTNSEIVEVGRVVSMSPSEGSQVEPGSTVHLYISKGAEDTPEPTVDPSVDPNAQPTPEPTGEIAIPAVTGLDEATARAQIEGLGLGCVTTVGFNEAVANGAVISSDPPEGTQVEAGTVVTLVINNLSSDNWVWSGSFPEPVTYNGEAVRLVLHQDGAEDVVIYEGDNPFGDAYAYTGTIQGKPGIATGTVLIYNMNGEQIGSADIEFAPQG